MEEKIVIENVVASVSLDIKVPLEKLVAHLPGTEYEPEQFPGLVYRMTDPKAAALIFGSGKVVCTGANSPVNAKIAIDKVIKGLHEIGVKAPKKVRMRIENIVARAKINENLNLNQIAFSLKNVEYEPEQFPGLVYRMKDPKVAFLLFGSGKVVCTGARKIKDVKMAVEKLEKKLRKAGVIK